MEPFLHSFLFYSTGEKFKIWELRVETLFVFYIILEPFNYSLMEDNLNAYEYSEL